MSWYDKECPSDPYDAYREGRRSRSYEDNPYEHGRYSSNYDCERAYNEWDAGHRSAERERREEREAEEAAASRAHERRMSEAREFEDAQQCYRDQEEAYYRQMDEQQPYPEPPDESPEGTT